MSLELTRPLLSAGMLAAIATGHHYPMDANGYEYIPAPSPKRPERKLRDGRFTRQRTICRRAMRRRGEAAFFRSIFAELVRA